MTETYMFTKYDVDSAIDYNKLKFSDDVKIQYEEEDGFDEGLKRWNGHNIPTYSAMVSVANEEDVAVAVKLARVMGVGFLATATRHGYGMTLGYLQGGLGIDLRRLDQLDIHGDLITVGAYTTAQRIAEAVDEAGYQLPVPSHSVISQVGVSIGAGLNRWSGLYGLTHDCMVSARVVLHDGQIIDASESENSDLFWAIRGAGANFGIVTSATFRMQPATNEGEAYDVKMVLPIEKTEALFDVIKSATEKHSPELSIMVIAMWHPGMGKPALAVLWNSHTSEAAAQEALAPFLALEPIHVDAHTVRWSSMFQGGEDFTGFGWSRMVFGSNIRNIDVPTFVSVIDKFVKLYEENPDTRKTAMLAEFFPNKGVMKFKEDATAYPWRDATCNLFCCFAWTEPSKDMEAKVKVVGEDMRDEFTATNGYPGRSVYVNYAIGDEKLEEVYGSALPRLLELKKKWDPDNAFRFHHPLVLSRGYTCKDPPKIHDPQR